MRLALPGTLRSATMRSSAVCPASISIVRIGPYSMVGGCCALGQDLPPFMRAAGGYRARMYGFNSVGLRRHGFSADRVAVLKRAYDILFRSGHRMAEAASWRKWNSGISRT